MDRLTRAALAAMLSILLVAGGSLALTQAGTDDLEILQSAPWTLSRLDGEPVPASAGITASFGIDGSLTGSAGCNDYTGTYEASDAFLSVGPLAATRRACEADVMDDENRFLDLLQNAETFLVDGDFLIISSIDGGELVFGEESSGPPAPLTGTDWVLVTFDGDPVPSDVLINAQFSSGNTVSGSSGCNTYTGDYSIGFQITDDTETEGTITIGPLAATRRACDSAIMDIENAYLTAMEQVTGMEIVGDVLTLDGGDGTAVLVFTAGGAEPPPSEGTLAGVTWSLVDLDGQPAQVADGMTVTFGDDGSIDGFGGCNTIFGNYSTDGDRLIIEGLAATRMFCEDSLMDRESLYIGILTTAVAYTIEGDELTITAADGGELIFTSGDPATPTPGPVTPTGGIVGPVWELTELQGTPIPTSFISVTISFAPDGTLTGNGGCNDFTGAYELDGESISLSGIDADTQTCDAAITGVEQGLLQILPFVDTATLVDGQLHLDSSFGIQSVWTAK